MLKVDYLGYNSDLQVRPKSYSKIVAEVKDCDVECLASAGGAKGTAHIRHVGTGYVAEGSFALNIAASDPAVNLTLDEQTLLLTAREIERDIPEGATSIDLSDDFNDLTAENIEVTNVSVSGVSADVVTLDSAAPKGAKLKIKDVRIAQGVITSDNNASVITIGAGHYQVHFVARMSENENTNMPAPAMMEFVKRCPKATDASGIGV